jgi:hypothetical protein
MNPNIKQEIYVLNPNMNGELFVTNPNIKLLLVIML